MTNDVFDPLAPLRDYQAGRCAVCQEERRALVVDHDHVSGLVRGLMCSGCNSREGKDAYAPWFQAYRANPPARQLGLEVLYGQHKPKRPRQRAKRPVIDLADWLHVLLAGSEPAVGVALGGETLAPQDAADAYARQCSELGRIPRPVNATPEEWRAALAGALSDALSSSKPGRLSWQGNAREAFMRLDRDRRYLTAQAEQENDG